MPTGVTTLLAIRNRAKQESDNVGQSVLTDPEWDSLIQSSYQELYALIAQNFGCDYFTQGTSAYSFTTDGINQLFTLPDGTGAYPAFFKLLGVDLQVSSPAQWVTLTEFAFADRNKYSQFNTQIPPAGQVIRVYYVPRLTLPTLDVDTIDGVNGWEEYLVVDACIKALAKEESDVSVMMARKQALIERLNAEVANRNATGQAGKILDVMGRNSRSMQYRLNGNSLWLIGGQTPGWAYQGGDWGWDYEDFW